MAGKELHKDGTPPGGPLDAICRYCLPYPIAILYKKFRGEHERAERLRSAYALVEGTCRFLSLVALADAVANNASNKKLRRWFNLLEKPGTRKFLRLLEEATDFLCNNGTPFVSEMRDLGSGEWKESVEKVLQQRNPDVHDDQLSFTPEGAGERLRELRPALLTVLQGLLFLRGYTLGRIEGLHKLVSIHKRQAKAACGFATRLTSSFEPGTT